MIDAESNESRLDMAAVTVNDEKAASRRGGNGARLKDALKPIVCEGIICPTGV